MHNIQTRRGVLVGMFSTFFVPARYPRLAITVPREMTAYDALQASKRIGLAYAKIDGIRQPYVARVDETALTLEKGKPFFAILRNGKLVRASLMERIRAGDTLVVEVRMSWPEVDKQVGIV